MRLSHTTLLTLFALIFTPIGCGSSEANLNGSSGAQTSNEFQAYWNQGLAEITTYELSQARYGELRKGTATLIYVTEPFSIAQQVKSDNPSEELQGSVEVLKLNMVKKFNTGIYPYSMMNSTFTSTESGVPGSMIKSTCTSQEWCGHTFTQWNKRGKDYNLMQHSYFQSEGDVSKTLRSILLEDELWSTIRIAPSELPIGRIELVPGNFFSRLKHVEYAPFEAECTKKDSADLVIYTIQYPDLNRSLKIHYKKDFPYEVEYFEESYKDGWGADARYLVSTAKKLERKMINYWDKNSNDDSHLRKDLGLD